MTDRLVRITTALAVVAVAVVAAIISYQHAYELVTSHGETGLTARLLPFTVDGLIWAASMVVLDASRRNHRVPRLAAWSLGVGIVATISANLAHGVSHGPIGAMVSAWPGSGRLVRTPHAPHPDPPTSKLYRRHHAVPLRTIDRPRRTARGADGVVVGAHGAKPSCRRPQPAINSPRSRHRPS
jgi:hypothetical protein